MRTSKAPRGPRRSVTISLSVDRGPARARHPDSVALDAAVELAAVLVLLEEGVGASKRRHAASVEHALLDHLGRLEEQRLRDCEAERLGGLEVDHQLEFRGLLDRVVSEY